jgi:mercuric ion transport protein
VAVRQQGSLGTEGEANSSPIPKAGLAVVGGLLGALAASSCCLVPLALFGLGISGAWIGRLTALEPFQPVFLAVAIGFLGAGHYLVYRRPKVACGDGGACARPLPSRLVRLALWTATLLVVAAIAFPYVAPALLRA